MPVPTPEENRQINFLQKTVNKITSYWAEVAEAAKEMEKNAEKTSDAVVEGQESSRNIFTNMSSSISGIFKGIGSTLGEMRDSFSKAFSTMTGHIREVLGPVAEGFDAMKEVLTSVFDTMKGIWTKLFINTGIQQKLLGGIFGIFKRGEKREAREKGQVKKKIVGLFGALAAAIGLAIGSLFGLVAAPTATLVKFFGSGIKIVNKVLKGLPIIGKFFTKISAFIKVTKGKLSKILTVLKGMPILGNFFKGFLKGFKLLGWPLAIIWSVIDFVKAFIAEQGTIFDKVKAGAKAAFDSLFDLPIRLLGWVVDKIAGLFGIEIDAGQKIMNFFHWAIDSVIDIVKNLWNNPGQYVSDLYETVSNVFKGIVNSITNWFGRIKDAISENMSLDNIKKIFIEKIFGSITNFFSSIGSFVKKLFSSPIKTFKNLLTGKGIGDIFDKKPEDKPIAIAEKSGSAVRDIVNKNVEVKNQNMKADLEEVKKFYKEIQNENTKKMIEAYKKYAGGSNAAVVAGGGSGGVRKDIPTESENGILGIMNFQN